jgi:glucose/arabinose dehydrogenase
MTRRAAAGTALLAAIVGAAAAMAGTASGGGGGGVQLHKLGDFDRPTYVHGPKGAGDLVFVVEQPGVVRVLRGDNPVHGAFLNIKGRVSCCGERGLLSIAFPSYKRSRRFYVYFTDNQGDIRVVSYKRKRGKLKANEGSARNILEIPHHRFSNHNGGQLQFGPDGNLWLGTGDGGGAGDPGNNAQDKGSLLGKLLRIDPSQRGRGKAYKIPKGNPYRGGEKGRDEIYARGLRNPWRFSFDRSKLVIGDVGQDAIEEVDYERVRGARGANFGWDIFEGTALRNPPAPAHHDRPIFTYSHAGGNCSITGGYVARDRKLPSLRGRYLYGDFCGGELRSLEPSLGGASADASFGLPTIPSLSSFGVDARKRLYVASLQGGVWRIVPG